MSDERHIEEIRKVGEAFEKYKDSQDGLKVIDKGAAHRFQHLVEYFGKLAKENGGSVVHVNEDPHNIHADLTVEFECMDLPHEKLEEFLSVLAEADVFGLAPSDHGTIYLDVTVNYLWEKKA